MIRRALQTRTDALARSIVLNMGGQFAVLGVGFVVSVVVARWLGPSDRGRLAIVSAAVGLGLALGSAGLPLAAAHSASQARTDQAKLRRVGVIAAGLLLGLCIAGFWIAYALIGVDVSADPWPWFVASLTVPTSFLRWFLANQLLGLSRFAGVNLVAVLARVGTLVSTAVLVPGLHMGLLGAVVGTWTGEALAVVVLLSAKLDTPLRESRVDYGRTAKYALRVYPGGILQFANFRLDVLVLGAFASNAVVGVYAVAEFLAEVMLATSRAFQNVIFPAMSRANGERRAGNATLSEHALKHHSAAGLAAIALTVVPGSFMIWVGYGTPFHGALGPFLVLLPSMWFLGTATVVAGDLRGRDRPGIASVLLAGSVVLMLALDVLTIPFLAIWGAVLAYALSNIVYGGVSVLVLTRYSGSTARGLLVPGREEWRQYRSVALAITRRMMRIRRDRPSLQSV